MFLCRNHIKCCQIKEDQNRDCTSGNDHFLVLRFEFVRLRFYRSVTNASWPSSWAESTFLFFNASYELVRFLNWCFLKHAIAFRSFVRCWSFLSTYSVCTMTLRISCLIGVSWSIGTVCVTALRILYLIDPLCACVYKHVHRCAMGLRVLYLNWSFSCICTEAQVFWDFCTSVLFWSIARVMCDELRIFAHEWYFLGCFLDIMRPPGVGCAKQ